VKKALVVMLLTALPAGAALQPNSIPFTTYAGGLLSFPPRSTAAFSEA
jgi:hypothetical protein